MSAKEQYGPPPGFFEKVSEGVAMLKAFRNLTTARPPP